MTDSLCLFPIWNEIYHLTFPKTVAMGFHQKRFWAHMSVDTQVSKCKVMAESLGENADVV